MDKPFAIFDMDGTLIDSMSYWADLGAEFLSRKGAQMTEEIRERIKPMTMTESAALFIREFGLPGTPESVAAEMNDMMDEHYRSDIPLKSGVREYLASLQERGVTMCVASATAEHLMELCLTRLGVREKFAFLLSCESVGKGKDRPDVYFAAARRLGAAAEDCAVYEDAIYAAKTARDAHFYVVGVYDASADAYWPELSALADETIRAF